MKNHNPKPDAARYKLACQCSISPKNPLRVTLFRNSAIVSGWIKRPPSNAHNTGCSTRNIVEDMSMKSAKRLLFWIANSECFWYAMATLTFRVEPKDPKGIFRNWVKRMQTHGLCKTGWFWAMEFQKRGATHYHVCFSVAEIDRTANLGENHVEIVSRNGGEVSVLRGAFHGLVAGSWIAAVGDTSVEFLAFQAGGIVELLRSQESAARYFAAYCAKKDQKTLPKGNKGQGRWWYCSPDTKPKPTATARLASWPFLIPFNIVFNKRELDEHLTDIIPLFKLPDNWEQMYLGGDEPHAILADREEVIKK